MSERGEAMESVLDSILEQLGDVADDDVVRTRLVLEAALVEVAGFARPRTFVLRGLLALITAEASAGELRRRVRDARAEIAVE